MIKILEMVHHSTNMKVLNNKSEKTYLSIIYFVVGFIFFPGFVFGQLQNVDLKFDFGSGKVKSGYVYVAPDFIFTKEKGYGFEPGRRAIITSVKEISSGKDSLTGDYVTSEQPFQFSVGLPEGNYKVTVLLGNVSGESATTVRAENRRLMVENCQTTNGEIESCSFLVNVRTPKLSPGNKIKLDSREWDAISNSAKTNTWDEKLTLEFSGKNPCVCSVEISEADSVITVFVLGDSSVTDGGGTWGQELPRWFNAPVVIANHAESGETLKAFRFQRRWDKVVESIKPGDYVLMQFGHNDMKSSGHDAMWPADDAAGEWALTHSEANADYIWMLATNVVEIRRRGGIPVIISPSARIDRNTGLPNLQGMGDYPQAAEKAARLVDCPFIDLTTMCVEVINGLGTELAPGAYNDGVHTNEYGGYIYSRCIIDGIKKLNLGITKYIKADAGYFDPSNPTPLPDDFFKVMGRR